MVELSIWLSFLRLATAAIKELLISDVRWIQGGLGVHLLRIWNSFSSADVFNSVIYPSIPLPVAALGPNWEDGSFDR